jgi:hypothetical protein
MNTAASHRSHAAENGLVSSCARMDQWCQARRRSARGAILIALSAVPKLGVLAFVLSHPPEKGDRLRKSKRMLVTVSAAVAVAAGGAWGAVAMAASSPSTTTPTTTTTPKSQTAPHHGSCPHMGNSAGTSNTMYSPSDV